MFEKAGPAVIHIIHQSPGAAQGANGRPALKSRFHLAIRPYAPEPQELTGRWKPSAAARVAWWQW